MVLYSPGGLNLADTTAPLILAYDDSGTKDVVFAVSGVGDLTITPDGGDITLAANLIVTGNVLIGTMSPATGTPSLDVIGAIAASDVVTDATNKSGSYAGRHYTNAEETITGLSIICDDSGNRNLVQIGGGVGTQNAATIIRFHTAADATTLSGTLAADIQGVGAASVFTLAGGLVVGVDVEIDGDFNHDGSAFGALGALPQAQQAHIIDADGSLADITTKFNTLLANQEGFGFQAVA